MAKKTQVTIHFDAIAESAFRGVRRAAIFLGLGMNAVQDPSFKQYQLTDVSPLVLVSPIASDEEIDTFKAEFIKWLTTCGLRELIESFQIFLEELHRACQYMEYHGRTVDTAVLEEAIRQFHRAQFPVKLEVLRDRFGVASQFSESLLSVQKLRNCLTHRGGIVGAADCTIDDQLELRWRAMQFLLKEPSGNVVVLEFPESKGLYVPEGGELGARFTDRIHTFKLNESVLISPKELTEIGLFVSICAREMIKATAERARDLGIRDKEEGSAT